VELCENMWEDLKRYWGYLGTMMIVMTYTTGHVDYAVTFSSGPFLWHILGI
jgi:hypothetical protein